MIKSPAFFLDTRICTGCKTCQVACKDKHDLPMGVRWRRVVEFAGGDWISESHGVYRQDVFAYYLSISCNHCRDPICVQSCPTKAMNQDHHGIVSVDPQLCVGCRYCEWTCPYSAPQFDAVSGQMTKCDFCREELQKGRAPSCVAGCPTRALQFGEYDQLSEKHGSGRLMAPLPPADLTDPNLVLEPRWNATPAQSLTGTICNPEEVRNG